MKQNTLEIILLFVISSINIFLISLPLTNILSYESSAVNGIIFSLFFGIYWLKNKGNLTKSKFFLFLGVATFIPFLILFISTIICQQCPLDDGIYFYLLLSLPSIPVGIAIAHFSIFITKKFKYFVFVFIWIIMLLGFLPELYYYPQIYFFNPIFGFYPGVIYDQQIQITRELIDYRIVNIIISLVVIFIFSRKYDFSKITQLIVITAFMSAYLHSQEYKVDLHYATDLNRIKTEVNDKIITEHFNIIIPDLIADYERKIIEYEHEYYFESISNLLEVKPDSKITSIIFESGAQKKELFGSQNADVAKPWLHQVYMNKNNYRSTLKHELAHIFSAKFGKTPFRIPSNFNPGMIEGFAMAVENNYDDLDIDYIAALAFHNDFKISLSKLFSDFSFFANASSLSYIYAGSFIKFLASEYGWDRVKKVYSDGDFHTAFSRNAEDLENEYVEFLKNYEFNFIKDRATYYFGRRPLIRKICARATARQLNQAYKLFGQEKFTQSSILFDEIYGYSRTYSSLVGYAQSQLRLGNSEMAIAKIVTDLENYENSANQYYLKFLLADLYALANDSLNAVKYYDKILMQNPHDIYYTSASNKKNLLGEGDSVLINYMLSNDFKTKKLEDIVKSNTTEESILLLMRLQDNTIENFQYRFDLIDRAVNEKNLSSKTYFEISKFAYNYFELDKALDYAKLAFKEVKLDQRAIIKEHITKLNWMLKNSD